MSLPRANRRATDEVVNVPRASWSTTISCSSSGVRAELGDAVDVVGAASDVDAAIEMIREREPEVVLVDVHMPAGGGARVISEVSRRIPTCGSSRCR